MVVTIVTVVTSRMTMGRRGAPPADLSELDHVLLVAIHPSGERREQHLQGVEIGSHPPILLRPTTHCVAG